MSYLTELHTSSTEVVDSAIVEVTTANNVATINTSTSKVAEVIPNNYTLSSGGIYSGYLNGNAPQWIADIMDVAISDYLATNYDNILDTYATQIGNLELGVSQNIVSIQNSEQSLNALITSVKSELNGNITGVSDIVASKIDAISAESLVRSLVGGTWLAENESTADSYIEGIAATKVQEGFAENVVYNQLVSAVNDTATGLTGLATAKDLMFTKTGIDPVTGALGATSGYFQELYADVAGNAVSIATVANVAATAHTWSAEASKLITSPDGSITGWSFGDGTNTKSYFQINATNFKISDGTTGYTPFSISGTDIVFNGKVSFNSVTDTSNVALVSNLPTYTSGTGNPISTTQPIQSVYLNTTDKSLWTYTTAGWVPGGDPNAITQDDVNAWWNTTTIDGGKITTGTIDANLVNVTNINAGNILTTNALIGHTLQSSDFSTIGGAGFRLKANAADTYEDPTIYGAYIRGGVVSAESIISGSLTTMQTTGLTSHSTDGAVAATISSGNATGTGQLIIMSNIYAAGSSGSYATVTLYRGATAIYAYTDYVDSSSIKGQTTFVESPFYGDYTVKVTGTALYGYFTLSVISFKK